MLGDRKEGDLAFKYFATTVLKNAFLRKYVGIQSNLD